MRPAPREFRFRGRPGRPPPAARCPKHPAPRGNPPHVYPTGNPPDDGWGYRLSLSNRSIYIETRIAEVKERMVRDLNSPSTISEKRLKKSD